MASLQDLAASDSVGREVSQARLAVRIDKTEEQQNEILTKLMQHTIVDKLVPTKNMSFCHSHEKLLIGFMEKNEERYSIHRHALAQMADVSGLTRAYLWKLHDIQSPERELWKRNLLSYNLNTLFSLGDFKSKNGKDKRYLVRVVGSEVRGFLSQSYNRKLMTAPLLRTFIETCRQNHAGPTDVSATDVRVRVKYMLPLVFEPIENEFVSFGVTFGNSDFGAGRLVISGSIIRIGTETTSVLSDDYSRTHLGRVIKDEDLADTDWISNETADKEVEAFKGYIRDKVVSILGFENVEKTIKAIQLAHEKKVPWYKLKDKLKELLTKQESDFLEFLLSDVSSTMTMNLPPVEKVNNAETSTPTAWWAANAVGMLAEKESDPDRRSDLQHMAGKLIQA
jgi:hypothetical protein